MAAPRTSAMEAPSSCPQDPRPQEYNTQWRASYQRFMQFQYEEAAGPRETFCQLWELCSQWLRPQTRSVEQILAVFVLEKFLKILPADTETGRSMLSLERRERLFTLVENLPKDNGEPENKINIRDMLLEELVRMGPLLTQSNMHVWPPALQLMGPAQELHEMPPAEPQEMNIDDDDVKEEKCGPFLDIGVSKFKTVRGSVTHFCTDYGWINESIFFNTDMVCGNVPLNTGTSVIALVEENKTTHTLKAIKVKIMTTPVDGTEQSVLDRELCIKCVTAVTQDTIYIDKETSFPVHLFSGEFLPCQGDLLLVEYSTKPGTTNMNIHTVNPLSFQKMDEACVTSTDGRTGVVESCIFFTVDSLQKPTGYTPGLYDIVNVVAVDSIQPHCSWRAISMIPVEMCIDQAL